MRLVAVALAFSCVHPTALASGGSRQASAAKPKAPGKSESAKDKPATQAAKKAGQAKQRVSTKPTTAKPQEAGQPNSRPARASTSNDKRVPTSKQPVDPKPTRSAARPVAAKSLPPGRDDERPRSREPSLKPPGSARPVVGVRAVGSRLVIPSRDVAERSLAFHYANLEDSEAVTELNRRGIAWVPASPPLPGVRTPIRLNGPLHGVRVHSTLPESERRSSAFEILDARLALALDDFCALLARHDVVELVHYTMYRPPGEVPSDWNKQIRHPAGLAIDVGAVRKADGRWLAIGPHWPSDIGAKTCGEGAREHWSRPGREIVSIACEAADLRMFHFILTPHFDAAHADHLHLEIKPDTRWFLVN